MKYRDKDGNVFKDIVAALGDFRCPGRCDSDCPLYLPAAEYGGTDGRSICEKYVADHPAEAAQLMGYEVVEDEPEPLNCGETIDTCTNWGMADCVFCTDKNAFEPRLEKEAIMDKQKPLADWTLGEVKEYCKANMNCPDCRFFCGEKEGVYVCYIEEEAPAVWDLADKPRFTDEEMELLKLLNKGACVEISRAVDGRLCARLDGFVDWPVEWFPSLKAGETVVLADILGE